MNEHISSRFNQELEQVRSDVMLMGGLVEQQLQNVLAASTNMGSDELSNIIDRDHEINELEKSIDASCQTILIRRQPTASDLRFVMTVIRVIVDLERIGDEVKKMALIAHDLLPNSRLNKADLYNTTRMGNITLNMVRHSLDAFARLDSNAVISLAETDKLLDVDYRNQLRTLITYMMEDPRNIGISIDIIFMNKSVERIGDHAENIAEHVVYLTKGLDIRHTPLEKIKAGLN